MSNRKFLSGISLVLSSFLLTGCYTQLQSMEYSERASKRGIHSDYYSWSGDTKAKDRSLDTTVEPATATTAALEDDPVSDIETEDFYYKDYETAQWYEDNFADRLYWDGYDDGFADGYDEGYEDATYEYWDAHFYSLKSLRRKGFFHSSFHFSWRGHLAFSYYPYYYNDYYWAGYRYPFNGWGYYDPFYDPYFYGGWGHHSPYRNYIVVYNDYHQQDVSRSRSGRHLDGPRSTGLVSRGNGNNASVSRSRTSSGNTIRSKNTGRTRSSGIVNSGRVRTTGTTGTRYTGRSNSTSSRGSRSTIGNNRSKESSSSVKTGRTRSQNVGSTTGNRTRSSGVTNRSRTSGNSTGVKSSTSGRTRSSGVRSSGNSSGNNRSVRSSGSSGRSSSGVRSNSGSSRNRSTGNSSSTKRKTRRSGGN